MCVICTFLSLSLPPVLACKVVAVVAPCFLGKEALDVWQLGLWHVCGVWWASRRLVAELYWWKMG